MLIPIDSPTQVKNAFLLLWASFGLITLETLISFFVADFRADDMNDVLWWVVLVSIFITVANAYVIYCASRRRNWARILLLALYLLAEVLVSAQRVIWPAELSDEDFWSTTVVITYFVMESVAFYWLFSGPGARWYAAKA